MQAASDICTGDDLHQPARLRCQNGTALVLALVMLGAVMLLSAASARIALQAEKAARNARDHAVAFHAAEAALADAEIDIYGPATRSTLFTLPDPAVFEAGCGRGAGNPYLGLCMPAAAGMVPIWLDIDFHDEDDSTTGSVPYGKFTGQLFQSGGATLPARLPRYIIELIPYAVPGERTDNNVRSHAYRITAIGYGSGEGTRVVLQAIYRKGEG